MGDFSRTHPTRLQGGSNFQRAVTACGMLSHKLFGKALITLPALFGKCFNHCTCLLTLDTALHQLARQFTRAMLAPRQKPDGECLGIRLRRGDGCAGLRTLRPARHLDAR